MGGHSLTAQCEGVVWVVTHCTCEVRVGMGPVMYGVRIHVYEEG